MHDLALDRRTLLKALVASAGGLACWPELTSSIAQALAIDPPKGSTYLDAEHVVFLMQENRSFDHAYGSMQGVRGFNDPRAIDLPGGRPVWLQANAKGEVFAPFRLDMNQSCNTWLGDLPHSWKDQVDALNQGKYDRWLSAKRSGGKLVSHLPLTLGYNTRADIPFYYALADAFTVCDQHFCSSLTSTTPNRMHFWTGTVREAQTPESLPHIYNSDTDHIGKLKWTTFPERLSEQGVSWKVYQNELTVNTGLSESENSWLGNFGDNPLEYFHQYHARFSPSHRAYLERAVAKLAAEVTLREADAKAAPQNADAAGKLEAARRLLAQAKREQETHNAAQLAELTDREYELLERGLVTNRARQDYRELDTFAAQSPDGKPQSHTIPKGDVFHQFREDVKNGRLPTVSWLVAPRSFSDHPASPWFGAWYVSETLAILAQNPEVWKKTIFVLTYDENDGYFDHCPPFRAPAPGRSETGACSQGIDTALEYTTRDRDSSIGLGYRVPLVVASPWSRGGWVNSQVCDHTSSLRFLEHFLERKTKKPIRETNINSWRRAVCGDLTSIFRPWQGEEIPLPKFLDQKEWVRTIHAARSKPLPDPGKPFTSEEIEAARTKPASAPRMPQQEPGTRPSCALPYELRVDGELTADRKVLSVSMTAGDRLFGKAASGSPFQVYAPGRFRSAAKGPDGKRLWEEVRVWYYAVAAGKSLTANWLLEDFEDEKYHLRVYGPNGFYRELVGSAADPEIKVRVEPEIGDDGQATGKLDVRVQSAVACAIALVPQHSYAKATATVEAGVEKVLKRETDATFGWYDFTISVSVNERPAGFTRRYAGRIETGKPSRSDPAMGGEGN